MYTSGPSSPEHKIGIEVENIRYTETETSHFAFTFVKERRMRYVNNTSRLRHYVYYTSLSVFEEIVSVSINLGTFPTIVNVM